MPASVAGTLGAGGQRQRSTENQPQFEQKFQKIEGVAYLGTVLSRPARRAPSRLPIGFAYVDARGVRRDFTRPVTGHMEGSFRDDEGPGRPLERDAISKG